MMVYLMFSAVIYDPQKNYWSFVIREKDWGTPL